MNIYFGLAFLVIGLFISPAFAQEDNKIEQPAAEFITQSFEKCDFVMSFPTEPEVINTCPDNNEGNQNGDEPCQISLSYTHVHIGQATIVINALCKQADGKALERFSMEEIETTLARQAELNSIQHSDVRSAQTDDERARYAIMTGAKYEEASTDLYMNQLWVTNDSFFSVEGTIKGPSTNAIDDEFAAIMRSVRFKEDK